MIPKTFDKLAFVQAMFSNSANLQFFDFHVSFWMYL